MVNNINSNAISEAKKLNAKQKLNALNELQKPEKKSKRLITSQKILLKLFDDLIEKFFKNNVSVNKDNNDVSVNEDNNKRVKEDNNKSVNEDNIESENKNDNVSESESEHNDDEQYYKIKQLKNHFKTIDETKPFEEQIEILKKKIL